MSDWLHNLPVLWMAAVVFAATYTVAVVIFVAVRLLAGRALPGSFKAVSPSMLPPLGILFGLFVAFTAAQVWNDTARADAEVDREAGALSRVTFLAASFPGAPETSLRTLIARYIEAAASSEWPAMAARETRLPLAPPALVKAMQLTLTLSPVGRGQEVAQREIAAALETALDARQQRIIISRSQVNALKWSCLLAQAFCMLLVIAVVHSENGLAGAISMGTFATGIAVSLLLIVAHDRPFTGAISVRADPLLRVLVATEAGERPGAPSAARAAAVSDH